MRRPVDSLESRFDNFNFAIKPSDQHEFMDEAVRVYGFFSLAVAHLITIAIYRPIFSSFSRHKEFMRKSI